MNNLNLGFVGVGLMGLSLIRRLSYLDYKIEANDKNLENLEPLKKITNVKFNQYASEISKNNNIIMWCLDKTESVKEVVFGKDGIVNNAHDKTIIVDLSTTLANETINFVTDWYQAYYKKNINMHQISINQIEEYTKIMKKKL